MNVLAWALLILLSPFLLFAAIIAFCLLICLVVLLFSAVCTPFALAAEGIQNLWHKIKK